MKVQRRIQNSFYVAQVQLCVQRKSFNFRLVSLIGFNSSVFVVSCVTFVLNLIENLYLCSDLTVFSNFLSYRIIELFV